MAGTTPIYLNEAFLKLFDMMTGPTILDVVPYKLIPTATILADLRDRGFLCDFYKQRSLVKKFKGEQVLLVADLDRDDEANFYWCSTVPAFERVYDEVVRPVEEAAAAAAAAATAAVASGGDGGDGGVGGGGEAAAAVPVEEEGEDEEAAASADVEDHPIVPTENFKSETEEETTMEVKRLSVKPTRPLIAYTISRRRKDFGRACVLDVYNVEKPPEYGKQVIPNYDLERCTMDTGVQAVAVVADSSAQTTTYRKVGKSVQTQALLLDDLPESQRNVCQLQSSELGMFLKAVSGTMQEVLVQNSTVDLFRNEFDVFEEEDGAAGSKHENNLRQLHTFKSMAYSNGKRISAIDWHPTRTGVVAFACSENMTHDDWLTSSGQVHTSHILIWDFKDVLQPECILSAPGLVQTFAINPNNPNLIVAGLFSGQVVLWDLSTSESVAAASHSADVAAVEDDKLADADEAGAGAAAATASASAGSGSDRIPVLHPVSVSVVDYSHNQPVTEIVWLPPGKRVRKTGEIYEIQTAVEPPARRSSKKQRRKSRGSSAGRHLSSSASKRRELQWNGNFYNPCFISAAGDGRLLHWDSTTAVADSGLPGSVLNGSENGGGNGGGNKSEHQWNPVAQLLLHMPSSSGLARLTRVALGPGVSMFGGAEDGNVVFGTWGIADLTEAPSGNKNKTVSSFGSSVNFSEDFDPNRLVTRVCHAHDQACSGVAQSPHFPRMFLCVGDWTVSIWRQGMHYPVFSTSPADCYLTCAAWSPTRPGVFMAATSDGQINTWDLLDQSHRESLLTTASEFSVSSLRFWQSPTSSQQFLAVGDADGNLHAFEVPRHLRKSVPNELSLMEKFYEREIYRAKYVASGAIKRFSVPDVDEDMFAGSSSTEPSNTQDADTKPARKKRTISSALRAKDKEQAAPQLQVDEEAEKSYQEMLERYRRELLEA